MTRPTFSDNPIARFLPLVELDGERDAMLMDRIIGLRVDEHVGGRTSCELELRANANDADHGLYRPFDHLAPGSTLRVATGDQIAPTTIFSGIVSAVEFGFSGRGGGAPRLCLYAEDGLEDVRTLRRSRVWEQTSLRNIVEEVLDGRLRVQFDSAVDLDLSPAQVAQVDETDLAFLRRILAQSGHDCQVVDDELHVAPVAAGSRGTVELVYGVDLLQARVIADLAEQLTTVTAIAYDHEAGDQTTSEAAEDIDLGQAPPGGRSGPELLAEIGSRERTLSWPVHRSPDRARQVAEVEYRRRAERFVTLEGETYGTPELRCGTVVSITGLAPQLDQSYHLERVVHVSDVDEGYRCFITGHSAWLGGEA